MKAEEKGTTSNKFERTKKISLIIIMVCVIPIALVIGYALISSGNTVALIYCALYLAVAIIFGVICKAIAENRGNDNGFLWGFFLGIIGIIVVAIQPYGYEKMEDSVSDADELKKFKELRDNGVITQEEFDAKKKQLLGL